MPAWLASRAALHLQQRGRSVVLVDRRGPGEETSYGNAGLIQREGVVPYPFPRDITLMARYAFNQLPESNLHWSALPTIAPWLFRYWRASTPEEVAKTARGARPLVERCITEHEALLSEAGLLGLVRRTGYMRVYRSAQALEAAFAKQRADRETYGVNFQPLDAAKVAELEPHLKNVIAGGVLMPDPVSVNDPGAVVQGYAELFEKRGGRFEQADARTLEQAHDGWIIGTARGPLVASDVVVALGPWSDDVFRPLGYRFPLGIKRGYHQHFRASAMPRSTGRCSTPRSDTCLRRCRPASVSRRGLSSPGATHHRRRFSLRASRRGRERSFRLERKPNRSSGWGAGRVCPTCCRSSARLRAIAGCGSISATITSASRLDRSRVGCWPR